MSSIEHSLELTCVNISLRGRAHEVKKAIYLPSAWDNSLTPALKVFYQPSAVLTAGIPN